MRVSLLYGHVASNWGDIALNQGVTNWLATAAPEAALSVALLGGNGRYISSARDSFGQGVDFSNVYGWEQLAEVDRIELLRTYVDDPDLFISAAGLEKADAVLLHSGEHLFVNSAPTNAIDLLYRIFAAYAAKYIGARLIILPSTFGPFLNEPFRLLMRQFFQLPDAVAARDTHSQSVLLDNFRLSVPVHLDPAFYLYAIRPTLDHQPTTRCLGLTMRIESFGLRAGPQKSAENSRKFRESSYASSMAYRFAVDLATRLHDTQVDSVRLYIQSIADNRLQYTVADAIGDIYDSPVEVIRPASLADYLRSIAGTSFVVSSRFHGCILGLVQGKPAIGPYFRNHGHKMPGLFSSLRIPEHAIDLDTGLTNHAVSRVEMLVNRSSQTLDATSRYIDLYRELGRKWLADALDGPAAGLPKASLEGFQSNFRTLLDSMAEDD